jgi:sugar phosphate isomerase/epimerase
LLKLEGKYANIHLSDNNPATPDHLPIGSGTIDWLEFFRILKVQNYGGYLGLDLGASPTIELDLRCSVDMLLEVTASHGLPIEI